MSGRYGTRNGNRRQRANHRGSATGKKRYAATVFSPPTGVITPSDSSNWNSNRNIELSKRRSRDHWESKMNVADTISPCSATNPTQEEIAAPLTPGTFATLPVTPERQCHQYAGWGENLYTNFGTSVTGTPEPFVVISQPACSDSEMETEMDEDGDVNIRQKKKSRTDPYEFSFKPTLNSSSAMCGGMHQCAEACWWKDQKRTRTQRKNVAKTDICKENLCHVCNTAITPPTTNILKKPSKSHPKKQSNSLLSYFHRNSNSNPSKPNSLSTPCHNDLGSGSGWRPDSGAMSVESAKTHSTAIETQSCAYCDRPACDSCIRSCEGGCQLHFCTFCSTINYDGPIERVFCFNCDEIQGDSDCAMSDDSRCT
jgi:hypothetical protein